MYIVCPSCKAPFQIQSAHLRVARGKVRCGQCSSVFSAPGAVFDDLSEAVQYAESTETSSSLADEIDELVDNALTKIEGSVGYDLDAIPAYRADADFYAIPTLAEFPDAILEAASEEKYWDRATPPEFAEDHSNGGLSRPFWWAVAAVIALTMLLAGQFVYAERYELARFESVRPWLETFCKPLACDLPLRRVTSKIESLERQVRDHPHAKDALLINASFVNNADFTQAYPVFQVSFFDVSGTRIAVRNFQPEEYLQNQQDTKHGLQSSQQTSVQLEVVDPGDKAVSFQFEFL